MKKYLSGSRGEAWVVTQLALFVMFLFAPPVGPEWPAAFAYRTAGAIATVAGIGIIAWSAINLGRSLTPFPRPLPSAQLVTRGAYRFVRHPIYSGVLLTALGLALFTLSPLRLVLMLVLAIFFDRKANREEHWLQARHPQYQAYRLSVKKFIPWIY